MSSRFSENHFNINILQSPMISVISESWNWPIKTQCIVKHSISQNWSLSDWNSVFTNALDHPYVTPTPPCPLSTPSTMQECHSKCRQSQQKKTHWETKSSQRYRATQFPSNFCVSGYMLVCKFCQFNVVRKHGNTCKDHLGSKAWVNIKEKHH